jgi:hypothetical protein
VATGGTAVGARCRPAVLREAREGSQVEMTKTIEINER